jgi:hypothetical protein
MNIIMNSEQEIILEGEAVLIKNLGVSKAARFLSAWRQGAGDYLKIKDNLFTSETVETLSNKIIDFEKSLA